MDLKQKFELAKNPNTPIHILEELSKDEDNWVRQYVAKNPNTPIQFLEELSKDEIWYIRYAIAGNPNASKEILISLLEDSNSKIRKCAFERLGFNK